VKADNLEQKNGLQACTYGRDTRATAVNEGGTSKKTKKDELEESTLPTTTPSWSCSREEAKNRGKTATHEKGKSPTGENDFIVGARSTRPAAHRALKKESGCTDRCEERGHLESKRFKK